MNKKLLSCGLSLAMGCALSGVGHAATPSAAGAEVSIVSPKDGDVISGPVKVQFAAKGMEVVPAGTAKENSGHHHLIIDAELPALDKPIPANAQHMHFGKAQTEATVELKPGKHTLQLLLGDLNHVPHQPPVSSKKITIEVK